MLSRYNELFELIKGREGIDYITRIGDRGMGDLNPPGINKSTGLKALMEKYNAAPEDFCFIGDGTNDIEAMEFVPLSFAVGNAQECVKSHARFVMDETNDDGAFSKLVQLVYGIQVD
nr:HAD superfamily hydrolase, putative [Babesia bovis]